MLSLIKKSQKKIHWKPLHKTISQRGALAFLEGCNTKEQYNPISRKGINQRSQWAYLTLSICQQANNKEAHNSIVEVLLFDDDLFPPESLFMILQNLQKNRDHSVLEKVAINTITQHLKRNLKEYVNKGLRKKNG